MARKRHEPRLSLLGYFILNMVAAAILLGVYLMADTMAVGQRRLEPHGLLVPLIVVWLCFVGVSVFDAIFDRLADRAEDAPPPGDARRGE